MNRGPKRLTAHTRRRIQPQIEPPPHLMGVARDEYLRVAGLLRDRDRLHETDERLLELYAATAATVRRLEELIAALPSLLYEGPNYVVVHPLLREVREERTKLRGYISDLGLSPVSHRRAGGGEGRVEEGSAKWAVVLGE